MKLGWRDAAATVVLIVGLVLAFSVTQGWDWPLLGGVREGIVALALIGFAAHLFGAAPREKFYYNDPFGLGTLIVAVAAMAVVVVGGLITGEIGYLVALMFVTAMLWIFATLRHAIEGRSSTPRTNPA